MTVNKTLTRIHRQRTIDVLIEGDAPGADRLAGHWAQRNGVTSVKYPADWGTHGKRAGPLRNLRMLREGKPELVVAFPGGAGTAHMVQLARGAGVEVIEVKPLSFIAAKEK